MSAFEHVAIVGAGEFGTAMALVADRAGRKATLLARTPETAQAIRLAGENKTRLPGFVLPSSIHVTADPEALRTAEIVLFAAPAQATRGAATMLAGSVPSNAKILACAKGLENGTGLLQADVLTACLPGRAAAVLSGPGFAEEIAGGLPAAVTIAAADPELALALCDSLASARFRPYASQDVIGVQLGGVLKNVLAIACGIVAGRELGEGARAALIARGLAEMMRLGGAMGGKPETFMGLSGLGDLVLTATSPQSRNLAFGVALGRGLTVAELTRPEAPLAEGALCARIVAELARGHDVDAPVIGSVASIVKGDVSVDAAIESLVTRPVRSEIG